MKLGVCSLLVLCAVSGSAAADTPARKPNVLLIYADDLGYGELGCYGGKQVPTPNIDSIAAGGIRFTNGYVSAPLCSPSRAGLMTGRSGTRFGHENNNMTGERGLPLAEKTFADRMKELGYSTGMVGKWHLGGDPKHVPMARGFDDYYGVLGNPGSYFTPHGFIDSRSSPEPFTMEAPKFFTTDAFAARAAEWITKHKDNPWFLYLPFNAIHGPHEVSQKYLDRFSSVSNEHQRTMNGMLSALDDGVGQVLDALRSTGQEENTLVFFISDNGAPPGHPEGNGPLRGHKNTTWEGGIRLPFMVQWKGTLPAGKLYDLPVVQLDLLPTCVAAAGGAVDPAWKLDGVNLLPYLTREKSGRPHETLYWRIDRKWAIRHGDMKLVHGQPSKDPPELFDLAADIGESKNLADAQPEKVAELQKLWDAWNAEQAPPAKEKAKGKGKKANKAERLKKRAARKAKTTGETKT